GPRNGEEARVVNREALEDRGPARAARGMKRGSLALLATVLPALWAAPHAATLGVSMALFDDNFLTAVRASMKARARELEVSIQFEDAQNDIGRQLSQIQNFIAQKVDAIVVNPVDTDATPRMTRLVTRAGIPLVYVNRMPADKQLPPGVSFVGSDETQSGTLEMAEVCRLLKGKGELQATVFQNAPAQGRGAVDTALKLARGESVPGFVWVPFELVTPGNLASYLGRH